MVTDVGPTPRPRPATLKDVAGLAGVSIKTAARVVNGEVGATDATRTKVMQAARQLNFRKNAIAGSMRRNDRRTASIGLIVDDVANPFFSALIRVIENGARERGLLLLSGSSDRSAQREIAMVDEFAGRQVDGLIVAPRNDDDTVVRAATTASLPVVTIDGVVDLPLVDSVLSDNVMGMRQAVDHLAAHGHRRIAYLGENTAVSASRERFRGFTDGMHARDLKVAPHLIGDTVQYPGDADAALTRMLASAEPPTAVLAGNNSVTLGALAALHREGAQHRVAMIGFDDLTMAPFASPALTVVAQDIEGLGKTACRRLFARLDGDDQTPGTVLRLPVTLVARGSGEISPV